MPTFVKRVKTKRVTDIYFLKGEIMAMTQAEFSAALAALAPKVKAALAANVETLKASLQKDADLKSKDSQIADLNARLADAANAPTHTDADEAVLQEIASDLDNPPAVDSTPTPTDAPGV